MDNFQKTISAIGSSCANIGINACLFGQSAKSIALESDLSDKVIQIILSGSEISIDSLYNNLITLITINKQIEKTENKYCVVSDGFVLDFYIENNLNIRNDYTKFADFTIDAIFYDLVTKSLIDPTGRGVKDLRDSFIKPISTANALKFAIKVSQLKNPTVSDDEKQLPEKINIEQLKDMLLGTNPGKAISWICSEFNDGSSWLFSGMVDLFISMNIPLPENITPPGMFSNQKTKLIDVYNEFLLFEKQNESPLDKKKRLATTLSLLVDTPNVSIETPYIDRVSEISASLFSAPAPEPVAELAPPSSGVSLFLEPFECPPYGCPECNPANCSPQCCCCSTLDIVSKIKANCHDQILLSCNTAGDGPGPAPCDPAVDGSCFPDQCENCSEACELAKQGVSNILKCAELENQEWWTLPSTFSPCECFCREGYELSNGDCALTCVRCENAFCESTIEVSGEDCNYHINLTPGSGCCGTPASVAWMFVIDISGSTMDNREAVADQLDLLIDRLNDEGISAKFGVTVFGNEAPVITLDFTTDYELVKSRLRVPSSGGTEYDLEAVVSACANASWGQASANFLMIFGDEPTQVRNNTVEWWTNAAIASLQDKRITCFVVDSTDGSQNGPPSPYRLQLAIATNGQRFTWGQPFEDVVNNLNITVFPAACECLDTAVIPLRISSPECTCCKDGNTNPCVDDPLDVECIQNLPDHCFDIPIKKCTLGQDCTDPTVCKQPIALNACGNTVIISPVKANMVCCSDVGFGCDCSSNTCETECCGANCPGSEICVNGELLYPPGPTGLRQAQDEVWCNCWTVRSGVSDLTPNCTHCCCPEPESLPGEPNYPCDMLDPNNPQHATLLSDGICCECPSQGDVRKDCCECCLIFPDGEKDPSTGDCAFNTIICRPQIDAEVRAIFESCASGGGRGGGESPQPDILDCVNIDCPDTDEIITGSSECSSVRHPDVVVLNNGIGLVAYEDQDNSSVIKIKQFKTSVLNKILPNRELNFGRLQNRNNWVDNTAKLYYYESIPDHLLTEDLNVDRNDPDTWKDGIIFRNGPLAQQCFPVLPPALNDENGNYITILIPDNTVYHSEWPSSDDIYNVKWFFFDFEDTGLIGDATDTSTEGQNFIISDHSVVDAILQLPPHIYNGIQVPVSFPRIACAENYLNALENSHFVYLVYQALEDGKWNIYLRQIRLSEYNRQSNIDEQQGQLVSLSTLNIGQVVYKIICTNDSCTNLNNNEFLLKRSIVMEVLLTDGREVFNDGFSGNWPSLCPGFKQSDFPRNRVFVEFVHSAVSDRCPGQFVFDELFFNWQAGQEYNVPFSTSLSASSLFNILSINGDTSVGVGQFNPPLVVSDVNIYSSSVGTVFYENPSTSTWSVISDSAFEVLSDFKGVDVDEPILLTEDETGHSLRPVVKVNYNNDVFVSFESVSDLYTQIKIVGTSTPTSSLPSGYLNGRGIDNNLNYFYRPADFIFEKTLGNNSVNEHTDMYIDLNDVIHLVWQSNRDKYWEIYYANSIDQWYESRLTNSKSKSLKPSISGSDNGYLFVTWHDNRHGNYEVFLASNFGNRIIPLFQQDPYLASYRNFENGWSHTNDVIPLQITNNDLVSNCYSNFNVDFYTDRTLENLAFSVPYEDFPFAFNIPDLKSDRIVNEFTSLNDWTVVKMYSVDPEDPYTILSQTFLATSPEIDTALQDSGILNMTLPNLSGSCSLETIEVRASNIRNSNSLWSNAVDISALSGQTVTLSDLGIEASGQYQQVRIKFTCATTVDTFNLLESADDADRSRSSGEQNISNNTLRIGLDQSDSVFDSLLRFKLPLEKNTDVVSAYLTLKSAGDYIGSLRTFIKLIDDDNTDPFEGTYVTTSYTDSSLSDTYRSNGISVAGAESELAIRIGITLSFYSHEAFLRYRLDIPKRYSILSANVVINPQVGAADPGVTSGTFRNLIYLIDGSNVSEFPVRSILTTNQSVIATLDDVYATFSPYSNPTSINVINGQSMNVYFGFPNFENRAYIRFNVPNLSPSTSVESAILTVPLTSGSGTGFKVRRIAVLNTLGENCPNFAFGNSSQGFLNYPQGGGIGRPSVFPAIESITTLVGSNVIADVTSHMQAYAMVAQGLSEQYVGFEISPPTSGAVQANLLTFDSGNPATLEVTLDGGQFPSFYGEVPVSWTSNDEWELDVLEPSPDVSSLVRTWLSRQIDSYTGGNYIGFVLKDDGSDHHRTFRAWDRDLVGSYIQVTYAQPRPNTVGGISWNSEDWSSGESIVTNDISSLVQSYLARSNYSPNQYMGLVIEDNGSDNLFEFLAYNDIDSAELTVVSTGNVGFEFSITSVTPARLCLPAGGTSTASLDITPTVRVDKLGNEVSSTSLPLDYIPNNTYFIRLTALENDTTNITFDDPKLSVSCESCYQNTNSWSSVSCSLPIHIGNDSSELLYYNIFVRFYYDKDKTQLITQLDTINNIECFTVDNLVTAASIWGSKGAPVSGSSILDVVLWPQLSNNTGLVCGIKYYADVFVCSVTESNSVRCEFSSASIQSSEVWTCTCQSPRWDGRFEDSPVNLREMIRWRSSGFGFSDTRITETLFNSLNPMIKIKDNGVGIIIYESDRPEDNSDFKIYASVFSYKPLYDMYASGAESVISPFTHIHYRSDIPICPGKSCFTDGVRTKSTLVGRSPAFDIDQFNSIFLAIEQPNNNQHDQQNVIVHRCGIEDKELFPPEQENQEIQPCDTSTLTVDPFIESNDPVFRSTVKMIRVNKDFVQYSVTRNKTVSPVVNQCNIKFTIVGTPDCVAIQLRNGKGNWSKWYPYSPEIGENTMEIDWSLSPGSGIKTVYFNVATYAGIATTGSVTIIADYNKVKSSIKLFKSIPGQTPTPGSGIEVDLSVADIWSLQNQVPTQDGVQIAAIRPVEIIESSISIYTEDYVFIEISPSIDYLAQIENISPPTFDFIQQGKDDQFNLPTFQFERDGNIVFRGKFIITKEGHGSSKDGLAYIIPHFRDDCGDISTPQLSSTSYEKDIHNSMSQQSSDVDTNWNSERNVAGLINYPISIRPAEDPYFIFGDPNYRLKDE